MGQNASLTSLGAFQATCKGALLTYSTLLWFFNRDVAGPPSRKLNSGQLVGAMHMITVDKLLRPESGG